MIFLDTNILVDSSDANRPFHSEAISLLIHSSQAKVKMCTSILCIGTYCYLLEKKMKLSAQEIKNRLADLDLLLFIIPSSNTALRAAYSSFFQDLEDAILYFTAVENNCDAFITQNIKDFPEPHAIPVQTPSQFLESTDK